MVICIKNLRVSGILGVYEEERRTERDIVINARLEYSAQDAIRTDSLDDALDYKVIRDRIQKVVAETKFKLLETLADRIVKELTTDARILKLEMEIDKPKALRLTDSVSAIINWERHT
jgi:D-erythro-7,8-dihydroneopterin triphosphate epimerase